MRIETLCSAGVITAEVTDTLFEAAQTMASTMSALLRFWMMESLLVLSARPTW